jgi:hypothetical protein
MHHIFRMGFNALLAGLAMALAVFAVAQPEMPALPEMRQFDFWLGEWDVVNRQGKPEGRSRIESIAEGNGILENWTDGSGTTGKSLSVYNAEKRCWQQFWVGNGTPVLEMSGGLVGGNMVLSGTRSGRANARILDRFTWTPNADGSVRQHWESSIDGGRTWRDNFDGIYRRRLPH